mmetsp:Transcript_11696/g.16358  ORF Transcript_11696/g.16358 Transcript_11696/m.16358 type:complete len:172 (+) Transcript_11696:48-563(+)
MLKILPVFTLLCSFTYGKPLHTASSESRISSCSGRRPSERALSVFAAQQHFSHSSVSGNRGLKALHRPLSSRFMSSHYRVFEHGFATGGAIKLATSPPRAEKERQGEVQIERGNLNSTYYAGFVTSPLDQPKSPEREGQMLKSTMKFVTGSAVVIVLATIGLLAADGKLKL